MDEPESEAEPAVTAKLSLQDREEQTAAVEPSPAILEPVRQVSVMPGSGQALPAQAVVKGYEYEKGRYVELEPEELKNLVPKTTDSMEIEEFVPLTEIDPIYFETSYYVVPEEAGEKAYALLYRSLQTTRLIAIANFAMHNREHVVLIRPGRYGLLAHTMFYESEVRAEEEHHADVSGVKEKELALAEKLIHSLAASFEPEKYKDAYRARLQALIDRKIQGLPAPQKVAAPRRAEVLDMTEALRRSLANLKKPAGSAATKAEQISDKKPRPKRLSKGARIS